MVFQFVISFTLIALTLTVHKQVKHMQSKDLGMNIDQTLVIKGPAGKDSTYPDQWESFVTKVSGYGSVKAVAASTNIPGSELGWGRGLYTKGKTGDQEVPVNIISTEPGFFILYDMKFASGRNFSFDQTDPDNAAILNEKAVDLLGFESAEKAIGQTVVWDENDDHFEFKIIGVIRNFNQQSPKQPLVPIIFTLKRFIDPPWAGEYYSVKFHRSDYDNGIKNIEKAWHQVFPDNPFDYFFLDSFFDRQYKADRRFGQIFLIFTALAILIANLGLLGLFSFTVIQRTKEIGIRKVLGATEFGIVKLLSNEYFRLILVAFALAGPIAYSAAVDWLEHFTYRISLGWWFFVLPAFVAFTMLAMTLALQVIKTARTNPVEALRYE